MVAYIGSTSRVAMPLNNPHYHTVQSGCALKCRFGYPLAPTDHEIPLRMIATENPIMILNRSPGSPRLLLLHMTERLLPPRGRSIDAIMIIVRSRSNIAVIARPSVGVEETSAVPSSMTTRRR